MKNNSLIPHNKTPDSLQKKEALKSHEHPYTDEICPREIDKCHS